MRRLAHRYIGSGRPGLSSSIPASPAVPALELEDAIVDRRARLEHLEGQLPPEPPRLEDIALVLERLPILGHRLAELPRAESQWTGEFTQCAGIP